MINNLNNLKKLISSVKNGYAIFINLKSLIFEWIEIKIDKNFDNYFLPEVISMSFDHYAFVSS